MGSLIDFNYKRSILLDMFLQIKNIPKVSWSSDKPVNLKPKISTFFFLCFGLTLFGLGEGLLIVSASGASPWSVLAQGLFLNIGFSVGLITIFISVVVLFFWYSIKTKTRSRYYFECFDHRTDD